MTRAVFEGQQDAAPGAFERHLEEGGALLSAGRLEEALGHLEAAHGLQPGDDKAQNLLGLCCFKLGHLDRAAEIYELLVRDNPVDATLRVNLGLVYLKANALQRAVREFETATDLAPEHRRAHNYLGLALAQAGEYGRAREHFVLAGSEHMAERMARALDGAGFEPNSTPAGGTLVVRARPSQVPPPSEPVTPRVQETPAPPVGSTAPFVAPPKVLPRAPGGSREASSPVDDDLSVAPHAPAADPAAAAVQGEDADGVVVGGESWDDDWNLEPVSTAPDGGPVASLRPARLEDSWGSQFGLEGEAPATVEAAEELVVELNADDEEPAGRPDPELDFGAVDEVHARAPHAPSLPVEDHGPEDAWIDGGEGGWDEDAADASPGPAPSWGLVDAGATGAGTWEQDGPSPAPIDGPAPGAWSGEGSALEPAADEAPGAWSGEGSALEPAADEVPLDWGGEGSALDAAADEVPGWGGEGSARNAVEGGAQEGWSGEDLGLDGAGPSLEAEAMAGAGPVAGDPGAWRGEAGAQGDAGALAADDSSDAAGAAQGSSTGAVESVATWGVPSIAAPAEEGNDDNWAAFDEPASAPAAIDEEPAEARHAVPATERPTLIPERPTLIPGHAVPGTEHPTLIPGRGLIDADRPTLIPDHASAAPEPGWARASRRGGPAPGAWLAELARGLVLGEPLTGDDAFSVASDGVTAIRLRDGLRTRTAGFLALEGEVVLTPEPRRKHGRATGQPFGPPGRELLRVRGEGLLHVRVPGKRLVPLELGEEGVYLREQVAYAFEESVMFENGSLGAGEGQDVGVVHLRGAGRILLELEGELRSVAVRAGAPVGVELSRLVGWLGEVAPQLRPAVTGLGDRVELRGSGFALLDAAAKGTT